MDFTDERTTAADAVMEAVSLYLRKEKGTRDKDNGDGMYDVVTDNDVLIEEYIKARLTEAFPGDSFLCEESGTEGDSDRVWVIDPIDGTVNYAHGIPLYGCQLALTVGGEPVMSLLYLPEYGETYTAERGKGAYLNGSRIVLDSGAGMHDSIVSTSDYSRGSSAYREGQLRFMHALHDKVARFRMLGSACCDFAFLASGRTDCHIRFVRNPWDFLPGMFLCQEAGAVFDRELYDEHRLLVMCASERALSEIVPVLRENRVWDVTS